MQTCERIHFCEDNISRLARVPCSLFIFYIVKNPAATSKTGSILFIITFREWSRGERGSKCVVSLCCSAKRRFGIIVSTAVEHGAEPPKTPCRPLRMTDTDGIKSSVARGGWYGELKFSIASSAPSAPRGRFCIRRN